MCLISVLKDYYGAQQTLSRPAETHRLKKQLCSEDLSHVSLAVFDLHPLNLFCISVSIYVVVFKSL